jgi:polar amino acid transport system substrate-binding protein
MPRRTAIAKSANLVIGALLASLLTACASTNQSGPSLQVRNELAPQGKLRAAINFGNPILAARGNAGAGPTGVSVDLATELARRLSVPVELITFESAGNVVNALKDAKVDIGFVAIDPVRGADIVYSAAYVVIEGAYLVRKESAVMRNEDVDKPGTRIVVGNASAYDLYLKRELKHATLVRAASSPLVIDYFLANNIEVAAGVKQQLQADAARLPGLRLLDGRFMVINQAIGMPRSHASSDSGQTYLRTFVEEMKSSGFVAAALKRHGIEGAAVGPMQP